MTGRIIFFAFIITTAALLAWWNSDAQALAHQVRSADLLMGAGAATAVGILFKFGAGR
jgi:hypothetical protein